MSPAGKNGVRSLIVAACSGAIFAAATFTLYRFGTAPADPLTTASVMRSRANNGIVLMPDGEGNCHKYIYRNDTGKSTYAGTVACDTSRSVDTRGQSAAGTARHAGFAAHAPEIALRQCDLFY